MDRGNYRRGGGGGNRGRGRGRGRGGGNSEQEQGCGGGRGGPQMGSYNEQPPFQPPQQWGNQPRASGPGQYQGRGAPYNQQGTGQHHTAGQNPGRGGTAWVSRGGGGTAWPRPPPQQQPQQHGSSGGGTAWTRPPPKQRQQDVSSGSGTAWIRAPPQQPQQHGGGGGCGNQLQRDVEPSRSGASNVRSRGAPSGSSPSQSSELGIEKSIFINPETFHLTVLILKLWNKDRFEAAAQVLRECMRGSPAKAYVVYAPVEVIGGEARLLRACQVIIDAFTEAGLVLEKDANRKLKLHATIMNAGHRRSKNRSGNADSFDARAIFGQYGSEEWGECLLREAHLSQMYVYGDDGYYHCCESIPFPEGM
ncbi:glutenin, high molecular weight subunit 12-like isoform X9 [Nicotiana tomentosiformis]|uniref:glutenin, high molecular weight subunit 12-like isoform X9 n=1 Tax=Nicotiana tomentosiformis TaxID=4098 RepID=UPI00388CCEBB